MQRRPYDVGDRTAFRLLGDPPVELIINAGTQSPSSFGSLLHLAFLISGFARIFGQPDGQVLWVAPLRRCHRFACVPAPCDCNLVAQIALLGAVWTMLGLCHTT